MERRETTNKAALQFCQHRTHALLLLVQIQKFLLDRRAQFTGLSGKLVSLKDALDGCERILRDEFKDVPESALYMIGAIAEAKAKREPDPQAEVEHAASAHAS